VAFAGVLDAGTADEVTRCIRQAESKGRSSILVADFTDVSFVDSVVLAALVRVSVDLALGSTVLRVVGAKEPVERAMRAAGVYRFLTAGSHRD
jgi:anti-anti-sigma factor